MKHAVVSALLFNVGWWLVLVEPLSVAAAITFAIISVHFFNVYRVEARVQSRQNSNKYAPALPLKELAWILLVAVIGWLFESFLFFAQVLILVEPNVARIGLVPVWLILVWLLFATLFRFSFLAIACKLWLQVLLGMCAVISYFFGAELNVTVSIGRSVIASLFVVAILWGCLFPILLGSYRRWFQ